MFTAKIFAAVGAASAFISVLAGAFGGHFLKQKISSEMLSVFETGVRYQMFHALALLFVSMARLHWPTISFAPVCWCFALGTVFFSGSLYLLALTGIRSLGAITPFGGLLFLAGWALLAWKFLQNPAS